MLIVECSMQVGQARNWAPALVFFGVVLKYNALVDLVAR